MRRRFFIQEIGPGISYKQSGVKQFRGGKKDSPPLPTFYLLAIETGYTTEGLKEDKATVRAQEISQETSIAYSIIGLSKVI